MEIVATLDVSLIFYNFPLIQINPPSCKAQESLSHNNYLSTGSTLYHILNSLISSIIRLYELMINALLHAHPNICNYNTCFGRSSPPCFLAVAFTIFISTFYVFLLFYEQKVANLENQNTNSNAPQTVFTSSSFH